MIARTAAPARKAPPTTGGSVPEEGKPLGSAYILHEALGGGAWGEVWRGSERSTGDAVAIKILRPELARDPQLVSRFLMERSMLLDVRHPNLVSVRDLVAEGGKLAIVMDLVEGGDLHYLIQRRGILDPREACGLLTGVASALATVHAAGIVHSDVKPANILVDERYSPPLARLTDFGLAALAGTTGRGPTGTPEYMAPELASGGAAIPATDLYACGVVMYEAVTGVLPYDTGGDIAEMLRSHVEEPVPRPPHLHNDVWEVIRSLLAKWPGSRPTAAQLAERLTALASGASPVIPRPAPSPPPAPARSVEPPPPARGPLPLPLPLEELLARAHQAAEQQMAPPAAEPEAEPAPRPAPLAPPAPVASAPLAPPAPVAPAEPIVAAPAESGPVADPEPTAGPVVEAAQASPAPLVQTPPPAADPSGTGEPADEATTRVTRAGDRRERRPVALTPLPGQIPVVPTLPPGAARAPLTPLPSREAPIAPMPPRMDPVPAVDPMPPMNPLPSHRAPMARPPKAVAPRQAPPTPLPLPGPKAEKPAPAPAAGAAAGPAFTDLFPGLGDKPGTPPDAAQKEQTKAEARREDGDEDLPDIDAVLAAAPPLATPAKRPPKAPEQPAFEAPRAVKPKTRPERPGGAPSGLRSRLPVLALVVGVVIAVVVAAIVANHRPTTVSTNTGGATYQFPTASYPGPVSVQRTWTLSASGVLSARIVITNAGTTLGATYDEVIPKSVAASADAVTFQPVPASVVQADPVVQYTFPSLAPGASTTVAYTAPVPSSGAASGKLAALAADQRSAEAAFTRPSASTGAPTLTALHISASPTAIKVGGTAHLTVTGTMSDGSPASATILQAVIWSESPPGIVVVSGSTAQGAAPGITKLTATDAGVSASLGMVVTAVATPTTPTAPATTHPPVVTPTHATSPSPSPSGPAQAACIQSQAPPEPSPVSGTVTSEPLYRLCDPRTGFRLYTTSPVEWSTLAGLGDVTEPAGGYVATQQGSGLVPLYRLTDPEGRQFLATTSQGVSSLEAQGAGAPQVLGYVPTTGSGNLPLYGASTAQYGAIYTTDAGEHGHLLGQGWHDLGVVANVFSSPQ